jgi:hypothetical protein
MPKCGSGLELQLRVADAGEVCRHDAGSVVRGAHDQALPVERLDDFGGLFHRNISAPRRLYLI